jgi:hypothetical protein
MRYKHLHSLPPVLFTSIFNGKKYIVPGWKEVPTTTTSEDIEWVKVKVEVKKTEIKTFEIYITRRYINPDGSIKYGCNCPGVWRSADKKCKHIKSLENGKIK